jgi:hypothetical protein
LEVPDFEAYKDCCTLEQMGRFMATQGFGEERRHRFIARSSGGAYYDVVYRRQATSA